MPLETVKQSILKDFKIVIRQTAVVCNFEKRILNDKITMKNFQELISVYQKLESIYFKDFMSDSNRIKQKYLIISSLSLIFIYLGNGLVVEKYKLIDPYLNPLCQKNMWIIFIAHFIFILLFSVCFREIFLREKYNKEKFKNRLSKILNSMIDESENYQNSIVEFIKTNKKELDDYFEKTNNLKIKSTLDSFSDELNEITQDYEESLKESTINNDEHSNELRVLTKNIELITEAVLKGKSYINFFFLIELILPLILSIVAIIIFLI